MPQISDEYMQEQLTKSREYSVMLLEATEKFGQEGTDAIVWEHGRRNFALRADGLLSIVCPVTDDTALAGVAIFNASVDDVRRLMEEDPGVKAGIFSFEVHPIRSFPGDSLPA